MRPSSRLLTLPVVSLCITALLGCSGLEPNTDLGLRVEASVSPRVLRISDTAAVLHIRVIVSNPSDKAAFIVTGGPPYSIRRDPAEGAGLSQSFRIASAADSLHAGPSVDWWGSPVDTIPAGRGVYVAHDVSLKFWRDGGWPLETGEYWVRSYYNGREGKSAYFSIVP